MGYQVDPDKFRQAMEPTGLDRVIGAAFPSWGAQRQSSRRKLALEMVRREFSYEAAQQTRLRQTAQRLQGPEDYTAFPDRIALMKNSRQLEQNFGLMQSIIDKLTIYAFGALKYQPTVGDDGLNPLYATYLAGRFKTLDLSKRHNLRFLTCLLFKAMIRDGDILAQWRQTPLGLRQTLVEGDRLGGIYMASAGEDYFQGITVNLETGEPVSYRIFTRTKANAFVDDYLAMPQDILHIYDPRRYDQYRSVTPFAPVLNDMRDVKEMLEACLVGTKFENYHSAFFFTDNGLLPEDPSNYVTNQASEQTSTGARFSEMAISYGKVQGMPQDGRVEFMKSERPSGTFQTYVDLLIRNIGLALNVSHGFLYSLMGLSGPGARMDCQQSMRTIQWHQENMKDRYLDRTKDMLLMEGIGNGDIPFTPNWKSGKWHFPPAVTIDVGRETVSDIKAWQAGLLSAEDWFAETGQDAREQEAVITAEAVRRLTAAQKISNALGVPLEIALDQIAMKTPNGSQKSGAGGDAAGGGGVA